MRAKLRKLILAGNITTATNLIIQYFPQVRTLPQIAALYAQNFIEIIKQGNLYAALDYAREFLAPYKHIKLPTSTYNQGEIEIVDMSGLL